MCKIYKKHTALLAIFMALTISIFAQMANDSIAPFSGTKAFRKWSIGINGGFLYPAVATGGSNDFQSPKFTLGNINWLMVKNTVIPYISIGAGLASWHTDITTKTNANLHPYDPKKENTNEMIIPVGLGFKINLSKLVNLDLGYRMIYVDND